MTIVYPRNVTRSLPNAMVGGGTILWIGPNVANPWSPIDAGNFATSPAGSTALTSGPLVNATAGGGTITPPTGATTLTSGPLLNAAAVSNTISSFGPVGMVNNQASTFVIGLTGSVAVTRGSLPNAVASNTIWTFGSPSPSSEPVISQWELLGEYRELGDAFAHMAELDADDNSWIEPPVLNIACDVAIRLMTNAFPVPQIFNHSPSSLVFKWAHGRDTFYLTVTAQNASILVSTPDKIKRRAEYTLAEFLKYEYAAPLRQFVYSEEQTAITVNVTSE